ncbi:MAG: ATP-binding protein [Rhodospirillaceae bacterium]
MRETRERLDLVVGNLPVALYRVVRPHKGKLGFSYLSAGIRRFVGFEADEIKRNPFLFRSTVHPDDLARYDAAIRRTVRDLTPLDLQVRRKLPTGEILWVHTMATAHRNRAGDTIVDGVVLDITAQAVAEEGRKSVGDRMALAIGSLQEGFAMYDRNDRLVVANAEFIKTVPVAAAILEKHATFEEMLRATIDAGIIDLGGEDPDTFVHRRMRLHRNPGAAVVVRTGETSWHLVEEVRTPDGGVAQTVVDISALKSAEGAARQAKEEAELASRSKSEFLANMSHELRTPLNSVIGMSEVIMTETFGPLNNPAYAEYARDINASVRHLLSVIGDILDIAKIEAGEIILEESVTDLVELLGDCERMVRDRANQAGLTLSFRVDRAARYLFLDARQLRQIVLNLLSNAIKFTLAGGSVAVDGPLKPALEPVISVSDTGIGIRPEDIPRVLELFSQVEGIMTRPHEGSGLGLSMVKSLTEAHGGAVAIDSRPGHGTAVVLTFPNGRLRQPPAGEDMIDPGAKIGGDAASNAC